MNMLFNNFLKPGTDLLKIFTDIAITLLFVAGIAGFMGWLSVQAAIGA